MALVERSALRRVVGVRGDRHGSSSSKSVRQAWPIGREARSLARRASAVEERFLSKPADFNSLRGGQIPRRNATRGTRHRAKCSMWAAFGPPTCRCSLQSVRDHFPCISSLRNFVAHSLAALLRASLSFWNCFSLPCLTIVFSLPSAMAFRFSSLILS